MNRVEDLLQDLRSLLVRNDFKVAVAESITGGRVQALLTQMSGSSDFFDGGITTYGIDQKVGILQVDRRVAKESNGVCEQTCAEMAKGAAKLFASDVALATTGYAEAYWQRGVEKPMAYVGVRILDSIHVEVHQFHGNRSTVQNAAAEQALMLLRTRLLG